MSHELRTPLNAILGFSEVMKSEMLGPMQNEIYKEYAGNIHESGRHLLQLINEILDLSRIEAGRYELHEEPLRLTDVDRGLPPAAEAARRRARACSIVEDLDERLPQLWADERAVRQICLNLMSNAMKFTPRGGEHHALDSRRRRRWTDPERARHWSWHPAGGNPQGHAGLRPGLARAPDGGGRHRARPADRART